MPKLFNQPTTLSYFDANSILFHDSPIWNSRFKLTNPVGHRYSQYSYSDCGCLIYGR